MTNIIIPKKIIVAISILTILFIVIIVDKMHPDRKRNQLFMSVLFGALKNDIL